MEASTACSVCQKPKPTHKCGLCESILCKSCAQFKDESLLSYVDVLPEEMKHNAYCVPCFDQRVQPNIFRYRQAMTRAKNVLVFMKVQSKETRLIKRVEKPIKVVDCADENETVLRLAFLAALKNFNAMIDVNIVYEKVRSGAYQTSKWHGTAVPTNYTSY